MATMGDRICVMRDGNIMQVADPLTLYRKPDKLFVAGFIGSLPMKALRESQAVSGSPLFSCRCVLAGQIFRSPWGAPGGIFGEDFVITLQGS